jgi:hypothetical protein
MTPTTTPPVIDEGKLNALLGRFVEDFGAAVSFPLIVIGERAGVLVARLVDPLVLDAGDQWPAAEGDGLLEPAGGAEPPELGVVGPQRVRVEADALAGGDQRPAAGPRSRRSVQTALRRLARALLSSTSGQKRAARSPRGCGPGCSASQPSSDHVRRRSATIAVPPASTSIGPSTCTRSTCQQYPGNFGVPEESVA